MSRRHVPPQLQPKHCCELWVSTLNFPLFVSEHTTTCARRGWDSVYLSNLSSKSFLCTKYEWWYVWWVVHGITKITRPRKQRLCLGEGRVQLYVIGYYSIYINVTLLINNDNNICMLKIPIAIKLFYNCNSTNNRLFKYRALNKPNELTGHLWIVNIYQNISKKK